MSARRGRSTPSSRTRASSETVPESVFLADQRWLDPLEVSSALALVSGDKQATSGTHGLALYQTTVQPGDVTLDPSSAATITGAGPPELDVQVQNQGDSEETDIGVTFELTGGAQTISGDATIPRIAAGEIQTASIPIDPAPGPGRAAHPGGDRPTRSGRADRGEQPLHLPDHLRLTDCRPDAGLHRLGGAVAMRIAFLGPAGTFSEDALRAAVGGGRDRCAARAQRLRGDPSRGRGRGRAGPGPVRELDRGRRPLHPRHARLRCALGDDRGRARPPDQQQPDRPRGGPAGPDRGRALPPSGERAMRAIHPRAAAAGGGARRREHGRGRARGLGQPRAMGSAGSGVRGANLRLRGPSRGDRGHPRERDPLRLGRARRHQDRTERGPGERRSSSPSWATITPALWSRR